MSRKTYSRSYRLSIPDKRKQELIDSIIAKFIIDIEKYAAQGYTSYTYDPSNQLHYANHLFPYISNEDFVSAFTTRFPKCVITDLSKKKRCSEKGIMIDWS